MSELISDNPSVPYRVTIPSLSDDADITEALKYYHYGTTAEIVNPLVQITSNSIAGTLYVLQSQVDGKINASTANAKGDILVASANDTVTILPIPTSLTEGIQYVLTIDTTATTGLKWEQFYADEERIANIMGVY